MRDRTALCRQQRNLHVVQVHCVNRNQPGAQQPQTLHPFERPHAMLLAMFIDFTRRFVQMNMDWQIQLLCKGDDLLKTGV